MFLVLTWKAGERPKLEKLPSDVVSIVKAVVNAARAGREIEVYLVDGDALKLVYPTPEAEDLTFEAVLINK